MQAEAQQPARVALAPVGDWFVYLLRCADGSLYTGIARDLLAREACHNAGLGAKYTRSRLPVTLVYAEVVADRGAASRREHAIKQLRRAEKLALIGTQSGTGSLE